MLLTVYQGRNVYNKTSQFFTTDKEWAGNYQSGQDGEIRIGKIDPKVIYQKEPIQRQRMKNKLIPLGRSKGPVDIRQYG